MRIGYRVAAGMAAAVFCSLTFGCGHPSPTAGKTMGQGPGQGYDIQQTADDPVVDPATDDPVVDPATDDPAVDPPQPYQTQQRRRRFADVGMGGGGTGMGDGGGGTGMRDGGGRRRRGGGGTRRRSRGGGGGAWVDGGWDGGPTYGGGDPLYAGAWSDARAAIAACRAARAACLAQEYVVPATCSTAYNSCIAEARARAYWFQRPFLGG